MGWKGKKRSANTQSDHINGLASSDILDEECLEKIRDRISRPCYIRIEHRADILIGLEIQFVIECLNKPDICI